MKERPLIFGGHSVRQIFADAKTQTRRVVTRTNSTVDGTRWPKPDWSALNQSGAIVGKGERAWLSAEMPNPDPGWATRHRVRPVYEVGDRIWVKETFRVDIDDIGAGLARHSYDYRAHYADNEPRGLTWTSPIFMPRAASRITLEIVEVRVERLHDISEADALAELGTDYAHCTVHKNPLESFRLLWNQVNRGRSPWERNDWVWVISFRRVEL